MAYIKTVRFNEESVEEDFKSIFRPGAKIEVVFGIDSLNPVVRNSLLYDVDYKKKIFIMAQSNPAILPSDKGKPITVATLHNKNTRVGVPVTMIKVLKKYTLGVGKPVTAVAFKYSTDMDKVSVRSSFRLQPNNAYKLGARFTWQDANFVTGKHFVIHNISISGLGILVPKIKGKAGTVSLLALESGAQAKATLALVIDDTLDEVKEKMTIFSDITFVRKNINFSKKAVFLGARFSGLSYKDEDILSAYIHKAQLFSIRETQR